MLVSLVFRWPTWARDRLVEHCKRTRVRQSEYLREAVSDLLAYYDQPQTPPPSPAELEPGGRVVSVHLMVVAERADALRKLSRRTRVTQNDYLLEAIAMLFEKYHLSTKAPAPTPVQGPSQPG